MFEQSDVLQLQAIDPGEAPEHDRAADLFHVASGNRLGQLFKEPPVAVVAEQWEEGVPVAVVPVQPPKLVSNFDVGNVRNEGRITEMRLLAGEPPGKLECDGK